MALPTFSQGLGATALAASSLNVVFSSAVTAGNSIVVHTGSFHAGGLDLTNVQDGVNAGNYSTGRTSTGTNASINVGTFYKLGIAAGAAASTYRVSVNLGSAHAISIWAGEYANLATVDTDASSNGISTGPRTAAVTATAGSVGFLLAATNDGANNVNSTGSGGLAFRAVIDNANNNQPLMVGDLLTSSLTVQPVFSLIASTVWTCQMVAFVASTTAGGAAVLQSWQFCLGGLQ